MSRLVKAAHQGVGASKTGRATGGAADAAAANGADPSAASSLERFEAVRGQTECVFARGTRLWGEPGAGATMERLAATTRTVVEGLTARDPAAAPGPPVDDPRWWLTFGGSALFVATFAPCYDATSSRYSFGLEVVSHA